MDEWPFKVLDEFNNSHGDFATLEAARAYIKAEDGWFNSYHIWQHIEDHFSETEEVNDD